MPSKKWELIFRTLVGFYILCVFCFYLAAYYLHYVSSSVTVNASEFLKEGNYSKEMLLLFTDIAFDKQYNVIHKWDEDIKVEIVNADKLNETLILEIDSIINMLSPLIYPVKMYKVMENGNLKIYRQADSIPIPLSDNPDVMGYCITPSPISPKILSWNIKYAEVHEIAPSNFNIILHEVLHAIGLGHPSKEYRFFLRMAAPKKIFGSFEESEKFSDNPLLYMSEEEKEVIKMLYSPYIKSGLRKKEFLKKMNLNNNDK